MRIEWRNLRGAGDPTAAGAVVDGGIDGVCGIIGVEFECVGDKTGVEIFEIVCCIDVTVAVEAAVAVTAVAATISSVTAAAVSVVIAVVIGDDGNEAMCC